VADIKRGKSVGEQTAYGEADCAAEGLVVHKVYSDDGVSASRFGTKERDDWPRLLRDLATGVIVVLWVWESSRGERELERWARLLNLCREHGVLVRVGTHRRTYDVRVPRDWRTLAEEGIDSAYESEKTSLRVRRAVAARAEAGLPHGRCPYGYMRIYDERTRGLVAQEPHPERAPIAREIIRKAAAAVPISVITDELNERGDPGPTGKGWNRFAVRDIAMSETYIARRTYQGQVYPCQWPPLIDEETHLAARRVLTAPERVTTRPGRSKWLLSYLMVCDTCEEPMNSRMERRRRGDRLTYGCGHHTGMDLAGTDEYIVALVCARLASPDTFAALVEDTDDGAVIAARDRLTLLESRLSEHYALAAQGKLSAAGLVAVEKDLLPMIEKARTDAEALTLPAPLRGMVRPGDPEAVRAIWDTLTVPARRDALRALLADIRLTGQAKRAFLEFDHRRLIIIWRDITPRPVARAHGEAA